MRLLILGGTAFLGRTVAETALANGHDVTCAARGQAGSPPEGATFVQIDRDEEAGLTPLTGDFDAVVDVASRPSHVRRATAALAGRVGHWSYVSTGSVYSDDVTPGQTADSSPIAEAAPPEVDDPAENNFAAYGPCKVACEKAVRAADPGAFICRAGLIVGPYDDSGRFTYWAERLARGGAVLAPGAADDPVQWVDVRDLAAWLVRAAETRLAGTLDGIGAPVPRKAFLERVAAGVRAPDDTDLVWVDQFFLADQGVRPWMGERSLPMWLPLPEYAGFMSRDVTASLEAGLATRDLADTARDTLTWAASVPAGKRAKWPGLTAEDEATLLATWRGVAAR